MNGGIRRGCIEGMKQLGLGKRKMLIKQVVSPKKSAMASSTDCSHTFRTVRIRKSFDVSILPTIKLPRTIELTNHRCGLPPPMSYIAAMAGSKPLLHVAAILFPESNSS